MKLNTKRTARLSATSRNRWAERIVLICVALFSAWSVWYGIRP